MLTKWLRSRMEVILAPVINVLNKMQITPNMLTITGSLVMLISGILMAYHKLMLGGLCLVFGGLFDSLDGSLARKTNNITKFGAFLDSTLDRLAEVAIYLGLLIHFLKLGATQEVILVFFTIVGSLMVSYTRARAEGVGADVKGGILTRFERLLILFLGLMTSQMRIALWIIAVLANFTVFQRIWLTYQCLTKSHLQKQN